MRTDTRPNVNQRSGEQGVAMLTALFLVLALALLGLTLSLASGIFWVANQWL